MGNTIKRDKFEGTPEGLKYSSLFENSVEKKRKQERNNSKRFGNINGRSVNGLINMVHDNVISQKLSFKGPFGHRRCKCA